MPSSFSSLTNLYEVIKTLHFELKPSIYTVSRIQRSLDNDFALLNQHQTFFERTESLANLMQSIMEHLLKIDTSSIQISKKLIKMIDADTFYQLKKAKISSVYTLSALIEKKQAFQEMWHTYISKYLEHLRQNKHNYNYYQHHNTSEATMHDRHRTSDVVSAQKKYCLTFVKVSEIIDELVHKTGSVDRRLKDMLIQYDTPDHKNLIALAKYAYKSKSNRNGYEQHRFGFNAKAINKKTEIDQMEEHVQLLQDKLRLLEEKKIQTTTRFDEYVKHFNAYVIYGKKRDSNTWGQPPNLTRADPNLSVLRNKQTACKDQLEQAKQYLRQIRDGNFDYQKIGNNEIQFVDAIPEERQQGYYYCTGDKQYCLLKKEKIDASILYGKKRGELLALEQQLINQQALTHFARLVKYDGRYFVVMVKRDDIQCLETIRTNPLGNAHILSYHSLTAKAVSTLLFERNTVSDDPYHKEMQTIRKKKLYKEKGSTDTQAKTLEQKENLHKLITWMNEKIAYLNNTFEGGVFDWKPYPVTQDTDDFHEFEKYITKSCYVTTRETINRSSIKKLDRGGKVEVYQLYNKDIAVHFYCATTERDTSSLTTDKKTGKPNLYTMYWNNLWNDTQGAIRLNPESTLYLRPAKKIDEIDDYDPSKNLSKQRMRQNKVIGSFQLVFYPTQEKQFEELQTTIHSSVKGSYAIGIDLGENSLALMCLVDPQGTVVVEDGKPVVYDLTMVNTNGDFVDVQNCVIGDQPYHKLRKSKLLIEKESESKKTRWLSDRYFSPSLCQYPIKDLSLEQLHQAKQELEAMDPKHLDIRDKTIADPTKNKVFDYAYAFEHLRAKNKINYHIQISDTSPDEQTLIAQQLEDSTAVRSGYVSKVVSYITGYAKKYNAMIVFENLDQESSAGGITLFSEQPFKSVSGKEFRHLKSVSPYQTIQNAVIRKCNYLMTKDSLTQSYQITPRLRKIGDIKDLAKIKESKECGWGTVIFVDESLSSQECPSCGFTGGDVNTWKYDPTNNIFSYTCNSEVVQLSGDDPKIKERIEIIKQMSEQRIKYKVGDLAKTRVKYTDLVKGNHWNIDGDPMVCIHCGYDTRKETYQTQYNLKSCDEIAGYIIARRGQKALEKGLRNVVAKQDDNKNHATASNQSKKTSHEDDMPSSGIKSNILFTNIKK